MALLSYKEKYVVQSTTAVSTTALGLADDTQASQTFNLAATQTVLVIYQANNVYGATMTVTGMQNAISIDGTDKANSWDSPYGADCCTRNQVFWIGSLASGSHTIKGKFASNYSGNTATISNRILLIYIFDGDEFQYVDSTTLVSTTSATFVDDTAASVTFTPSGSCKALYLYNTGKDYSATEYGYGKKCAISVAGTDYSQAEKSPWGDNSADSVFTCYAGSLTATETTTKGRFASNSSGSQVDIDRRQLGVLLLADTTLLDIIVSDTQVSTTSNTLVDDAQASISRTTTDTRELLVVAMGTKRHNTSSTDRGECYGILTNTVDRQNSRGSFGITTAADSAATCWAENLAAGNHNVKGRFSNNTGTNTAVIDSRRVIALWFSVVEGQTYYQTLVATEVAICSLSIIMIWARLLSVIESSIASLSKIMTYLKSLIVTEVSNVVMSLVKTFYRILSVVENSIASLVKGIFKILSVVESSVVTISKIITWLKSLAVVETSIVGLGKVVSFFRSLATTEISVPAMSLVKTFYRVLSSTVISVAGLIANKIGGVVYYVTMEVAEISIATMGLAKSFYRALSVVESSVISLTKGLFKTLTAIEVSIASLVGQFIRGFLRPFVKLMCRLPISKTILDRIKAFTIKG